MKKNYIQILVLTISAALLGGWLSTAVANPAGNKAAGTAYLAANGKRKNIITTPSGLQYEVLSEGTGKMPKASDTVTVHYKGTKINGTEFDSSYSRNEPTTFAVKDLIDGWAEGLQLMKEGAKYRFFIPPKLAYGETGGGAIEPNETLIFDVELIKVQ